MTEGPSALALAEQLLKFVSKISLHLRTQHAMSRDIFTQHRMIFILFAPALRSAANKKSGYQISSDINQCDASTCSAMNTVQAGMFLS